MTAKPSDKSDQPGQQDGRTATWLSFIPVVIFVLVIVLFVVIWSLNQQDNVISAAERQQLNHELGLPTDFPSDVVPIYAGVEILDSERGSAESMDGEPMDKWVVHGQIDSERKPILDSYNEVMVGQGMGQTQFISVPAMDGSGANYQVSFADEQYLVEIYIQKLSTDLVTQIELTVYRVRNQPAI